MTDFVMETVLKNEFFSSSSTPQKFVQHMIFFVGSVNQCQHALPAYGRWDFD